jgi:hypothetical protein
MTTNSSDIILDNSDTKRRSWLYKSLIKPYKKGSKSNSNKSTSTISENDSNNTKSPAASIADEFYRSLESESHLHNRSNSSQVTTTTQPNNNNTRRHSFDSFHSIMKEEPLIYTEEEDQALTQWDKERINNNKPVYTNEERPNFHLSISTDNIQNDYIPASDEDDDDEDEYVEARNTGTNTPVIVIEDTDSVATSQKEDLITFMFDYYSLPAEVKLLIDAYEKKGKAERKKMIVKYKKQATSDTKEKEKIEEEEEEEEDEEEEDEEEEDGSKRNTVDYRDLITGNYIDDRSTSQKDTRYIAIVTTSRSDNIEFTKLIQIAMESSSDNEPLLDLHVSLFGNPNDESDNNIHQEEFQDVIMSIEKNIERFQGFRNEASVNI